MPLLSASEIADMRSTQNDTMPDTMVVWRYTTASDGMGGLTETWAAVGTVTGRVAPAGRAGSEQIIAERLTASEPWVITVPTGTTVYARDRFVIAGRTFEVEYVNEHEAWETALQCYGYEVSE
jgi:head-tail adaptor